MTDLFIHLYLDEDVDILLADLLRANGFAVTTTLEAANLQLSDEKQLAYATANRYAILTHNRKDFQRLAQEYFAEGKTHAGIIIAIRHPLHEILDRLDPILNRLTADEITNQLCYI